MSDVPTPDDASVTTQAVSPDSRGGVGDVLERVSDLLPGSVYAFRRSRDGAYSFPFVTQRRDFFFGLVPGALHGAVEQFFARVHADDLAAFSASIEQSAAELTTWTHRFRFMHPELGERWIVASSHPEKDADGNVTWYGVATDITDAVASDREMNRRQAMLSAIIDFSPSVLTVKDLAGRYVLGNPNMQRLVGRSEAEIVGRTAFDLFDDESARNIVAIDQQVVATGEKVRAEERVVVDGVERFYNAHKFPLLDENGRVGYICSISLDITEQRRNALELAERELLFHNVFNAQFQYMSVLDPDGRVREISDLPLKVAHARREDYVGQYFWMAPGWRDRPEWHAIWQDRLRQAAAQDGPVLTEDEFNLPDGSIGYADAATTAVRDAHGELQYYIIQASDSTARKRAELALRSSELANRTILDSLSDGVFVVHEGAIVFVNPAFASMLGYTVPDMARLAISDLIPAEHRGAWQDVLAQTAGRNDRTVTLAMELHTRGEPRRVAIELRARAVMYLGRPGVLGIVRDVTERLKSEVALRQSELRFRQLAESVREVFWLSNVEKNEVLYISPAFETIWGRSLDALRDSATLWMEAIHPDDRERIERAAREQQAQGTYDEEYRIVRPDGEIRWIHDHAYPVRDESGVVTRIAGVAEDITERRTLEESLRQTQKMESIGQLAGGVAHDFNNSLTVIMGCARLLESERTMSSDSGALLTEIQHAAERAASLTRQLLAFSRQEVLAPRVLDLNVAIGDTHRMLERLLGEDVMIMTWLDPSVPNVKVDPGHVVQLLMNLAVNARDAMPHGGTLEIATALVRHDAEHVRHHPGRLEGDYVELRVSDVGTGMSPEIVSKIFEPFFTTKAVGRGTGLGLSVVHGIVTQNDGTIDVESTPGVGTTFRVAFPAVYEGTLERTRGPANMRAVGTERLLLVEDDDSVRRIAARALRSANYHVLVANDGVEALQLLAGLAAPIDALITDVVMPRMGGAELADGVRAICPQARILFTSGYTNDALSRSGITEESVAFLQKPYAVDDLLEATRRLLDGG
ncbi:MAG: PAS domain S-box protein [Gemmatimonadaceae bacterium]|nr:PAS domain S-box protein [Gemmatimonadaceae bacterium]